MALARRLATVALILACLAAGLVPTDRGPAASEASGGLLDIERAAEVGWPPSTGLLVAEIVTGGASASDEWVEIANVASATVDLAGLDPRLVVAGRGAAVGQVAARQLRAVGAGLAPAIDELEVGATTISRSFDDARGHTLDLGM